MQFNVTEDPTFLESLVGPPEGLNTGALEHWDSVKKTCCCYLYELLTMEAFMCTARYSWLLEGHVEIKCLHAGVQLAPSTPAPP